MITFHSISTHSELIEENEFFELFYNPDASYMYDYNFMRLKYQPTLEEFKLIENILLDFREDTGMSHVKFYWPENTGFSEQVLSYLNEQQYSIGLLELYAIEPKDFLAGRLNSSVHVQLVTEATLEDYKQISFLQDKEIGNRFAEKKQNLYDANFLDPHIHQVIAYLDGDPVGGVDLLEGDGTLEIDNLFVNNDRQRQGIGTSLQQFAMDFAGERTVILVADGEDTPKEMYAQQNYTYISFQVSAQKELN